MSFVLGRTANSADPPRTGDDLAYIVNTLADPLQEDDTVTRAIHLFRAASCSRPRLAIDRGGVVDESIDSSLYRAIVASTTAAEEGLPALPVIERLCRYLARPHPGWDPAQVSVLVRGLC